MRLDRIIIKANIRISDNILYVHLQRFKSIIGVINCFHFICGIILFYIKKVPRN